MHIELIKKYYRNNFEEVENERRFSTYGIFVCFIGFPLYFLMKATHLAEVSFKDFLFFDFMLLFGMIVWKISIFLNLRKLEKLSLEEELKLMQQKISNLEERITSSIKMGNK